MNSKSEKWTDPTLLEKIGNLLYSEDKYLSDEKGIHQLKLVANDPYNKCRLSYLHFNEWYHEKFYKFWHDRQDFWLDLAEVFRFTSILVVLSIKNREDNDNSIIQTAATVCDLTVNALINVGFQNKINQNDLSWRIPEVDDKNERDVETSSDNSWSIIEGNRCSTAESHDEVLGLTEVEEKSASVFDAEEKEPKVIATEEKISESEEEEKLVQNYQEPLEFPVTIEENIELNEIERQEKAEKSSENSESSDESTSSSSDSSESRNEQQYQRLEEEIELQKL